jgi:predicted transposase/invertase (TIGR01784 family)
MPGYLNPKNDIPFKRIFGEHAHLLISFLNALLPLEKGRQIVSLTYLPPEEMPESLLGKQSVVDVMCKDSEGRAFIVEMQMYWSPGFANRLVFNGSRVLVKQMNKKKKKGKALPFHLMQPVYSLAIVVYRFAPKDGNRWYYHYRVADIVNPKRILKGLEFIIVDLENFKPNRPGLRGWNMDKKRMAVLWLRFLKELDDDVDIIPTPALFEQEEVKEALEICEVGRYSPSEMEAYENYWDVLQWEDTLLYEANQKAENLAMLAEKDKKLAEKDTALAAQADEINALKHQLDAMKKDT